MKIAILSYRIAGNDGVSLECKHWKTILTRMGHKVTFLAGELDAVGELIPELHFQWPYVVELHDKVVYGRGSIKQVEDKIFDIAGTIEGKLRKVLNGKKKVDLLIVANSLSLPMHFPLAIALKRVVEELNIPTISRNHDFWWERKRFLKSRLFPFFERWFPPDLRNMRHVVINSEAQRQLKKRRGVESVIISDSFDFGDTKYLNFDSYASGFRKDLGIKKEDIVFLQATRIIPRKRFELAIRFMKKLNDPNAIFVIAGHAGDEGKEYEEKIRQMAKESGIRHMFIGDSVNSRRRMVAVNDGKEPRRKKIYTLWDCYLNSDFVLYPTEIEGFGNQFIEAVFFKKPVIMTEYPVYKEDIKPLGFEIVNMGEKITDESIIKTKELINNKDKRDKMTARNFKLGENNFSYKATAEKIDKLISSFKD